jgi:hypothetical protein
MYSTYQQAQQAVDSHGFNQKDFNEAAQDSQLFAVFMAEFNGVSPAQVTLWLNAMRPQTETEGA